MAQIDLEVVAKEEKGLYRIKKDGATEKTEIIRTYEDTEGKLKRRTIEVLLLALNEVAEYVKHEDTLTIWLENRWLVNWLQAEEEVDEFEKLATVYKLIDGLDCKVRFATKSMRNDKRRMALNDRTDKDEYQDFASLMIDEFLEEQ